MLLRGSRFNLYLFMRTLSAIVVASAALAGCSANMGATNDVDADSVTPSTAVVVLERTSQGPDTTRVGAVARFVHTRSGQVDERALRTVGAQLDLPAPGACAALIACWRWRCVPARTPKATALASQPSGPGKAASISVRWHLACPSCCAHPVVASTLRQPAWCKTLPVPQRPWDRRGRRW